jgi:hypothetical protein
MNVSLLPIFNSTDSFTLPIVDVLFFFVFPSIFGFTAFLKLVSLIILYKMIRKIKINRNNNMFYYIFIYELSDFIAALNGYFLKFYHC